MTLIRGIPLASLLILTMACASTAPVPSPEIVRLRSLNLELRRDAAMSKVEIARLEKSLQELEAELEATRLQAAELASRPVPDVSPMTRAPSREQPVEEVDLVDEPQAMPVTAVPSTRDPQRLYDSAYSLFHEQRYDQAASRFREFIELFPTSELADNAQFWIGECHYARGDFEKALIAFSETVERYPNGNKVADSLLKAGRCLAGLGDEARARATYEEVRQRFPGTGAAASAADLLRER